MTSKWIPESPTKGAYYASKVPKQLGKLGSKGTEYGTYSVSESLQFDKKEDCEKWCDEWNSNNKGKFDPIEHGFN